MATLAEIRARLSEQAQKSSKATTDNSIYAHWNIPEGTSALVRFLPDKDNTNTFFWRERQMIRIPFDGVKGGEENKKIVVQVPCVEMWGETCPVHATIRPWFKDPNMEKLGRTYWKKRSYVFQGFVVNNPLAEDSVPENPIRRFIISPQIFTIIKQALMDPEMEELPTDYQRGTDFRINKTQKGGYADYSTSSWARKERGLNEDELAAIQTHGLYNLVEFMPKKPSKDDLDIIMQMFEASVAGELYDAEKWKSYRPLGAPGAPSTSTASTSTSSNASDDDEDDVVAVKPVARAVEAKVDTKVVEAATDGAPKPSVDDILKMIRNRQKS